MKQICSFLSGIASLNRYSDSIDATRWKMSSFLNSNLKIRTFHNDNFVPSTVHSGLKRCNLPPLTLITQSFPQFGVRCPILDPVNTILTENELNFPELFDLGKMAPKMAARLIVIRRKKMRKHKLRKLRKRMKYVWEKRDARRAKRRERKFQDEILTQIRHAKLFDAKIWVEKFLEKSNSPLPVPKLASKPRP